MSNHQSSQSAKVLQVQFNNYAQVFLVLVQTLKMKCLVNSRRIVANKNKQVFFTWQLENKLLKAFVLWMNDSIIHRNMKLDGRLM